MIETSGHQGWLLLDDAAAALDDEGALSADDRTFAEIRGYRQALGLCWRWRRTPTSRLDVSAVRACIS